MTDMALIVIHILCGVLVLIGLTAVICGVTERVTAAPDDGRYLLVVLKGEDAGERLRAAVEEIRNGRCRVGAVLAVDAGLTEEARRICRRIADGAGCVAVMTAVEFQNWLGGVAGEPNV